MLRVKVCGLRTPDDVAVARDADYAGFVVASPKSHRNLPVDAARRLMDATGPDQRAVAVTVEEDLEALTGLLDALRPHAVQLHRGAPAATREALRQRFPDVALWVAADDAAPPGPWDALVVDARTPDGYGGTGRVADWVAARRLRDAVHPRPLVLAGGLTPETVAEAAAAVRPSVVDVSSGVEGEKGKVPERVHAFIQAARGAEVKK